MFAIAPFICLNPTESMLHPAVDYLLISTPSPDAYAPHYLAQEIKQKKERS
jgi:hypothetical protein